ncbi:hypothetical protein [Aquimarina celericrescens]|uniref:ATPase n=1 Tax=Aquimarina celericrescens TaxID=1964542 RepID=A0ABW5ATH2_9FLAO|nr:hypothetical protein [Aquimarina celericrescens]
MESIRLNNVSFVDDGTKIHYDYQVSKGIKKYFDLENKFYVKYGQKVEDTPLGLAVIPFISNIMPIAWFLDADVIIEELDTKFYDAVLSLKEKFKEYFPNRRFKGDLEVENLISDNIDGEETALLFSGGLDSFECYTRNYNLNPFLISIHGADVGIGDTKRWNDFVRYNSEEEIVNNERLFYIESNLREFYTYQVELLVNLGWWGKVQHGMALLGVIAPLGYQLGIDKIFIASSDTEGEIDLNSSWGSSPFIDEKMRWANSKVIHDGYQFSRTDKTDNLVSYVKTTGIPIKLRVCYSEKRDGYNCNVCEKCQRTIFGLILSGADPNIYGFNVPDNIYELILGNFTVNRTMDTAVKYLWKSLQVKAKSVDSLFILNNKEKEEKQVQEFINLDLDQIINTEGDEVTGTQKIKFVIRNRFPWLLKLYKSIK